MNAYLIAGYVDNEKGEFNILPYEAREFRGIREMCKELNGFAYPVVAKDVNVALKIFSFMDCKYLDEQYKDEIKKLL